MDWMQKLTELKIAPIGGEEFAPLSEQELLQIEETLGARLPDPYRLFLKRYGASDFQEYAVSAAGEVSIAPGWFYGHDLKEAITEYQDRLPRLIVPINEDNAQNLVCISLRDDSYGAIFFQHHGEGIGDLPDSQEDLDAAKLKTLDRLAPDFPSFICSLKAQ